MFKNIALLLILILDVHATGLLSKITFDITIGPLFPGNQKMYNAVLFNEEPAVVEDTLTNVKDSVDWMYGYAVGG